MVFKNFPLRDSRHLEKYFPYVDFVRRPTSTDIRHPKTGRIYSTPYFWRVRNLDNGDPPNTGNEGELWYLEDITAGVADWKLILFAGGGSGILTVTGDAGGDVSGDMAGNIDFIGNVVANASNAKPVFFQGTPLSFLQDLEVQLATTVTPTPGNSNSVGLSCYNEQHFSIDATSGMVSLIGGGMGIDSIGVDFATAPGTDPVAPDGAGLVTVSGQTVSNATNLDSPLATHSRAANEFNIELQVASAVAPSPVDAFDAGIVSLDNTQFTVNTDTGFAQFIGGTGPAIQSVTVDDFTAPGTQPVVSNAGSMSILGDSVAQHGVPVETHSRAANAFNVEVQIAGTAAASDPTLNGICHFDSADFGIDADGFLTLSSSGAGQTITGNTGGALSPTGGNWNIVTDNATVTFAGALSTLTQDFNLTNLVLGSSLPALTVGSANVAMGADALKDVTSGAQNVAIGHNAAQVLTTGSNNVGVGKNALLSMTGSVQNVAVGHSALAQMTTSVGSNTAVGYAALLPISTGTSNISIGSNSSGNFTGTESSNIIIGSEGVAADNNTIRIGTPGNAVGQQDTTFVAGITGTTVAGSVVNVASTGQLGDLGFGTSGQVLTSNGAGVSPTWQAGGGGGGVAGPTNISNGLGTWNLGMSYSAGTVTIHGADGNALSGSNIGYVTLRSNVNPGQLVTYPLTSNVTFDDSAGTSVFAGSLFGFNTGDTTSSAQAIAGVDTVPFFLYAVADDNDANLIFACSRVPTFVISDTSRFFNAASGSADEAYDLLALQSVTIGNYDNNEVFLVGSFEMNKTAGDDWTVVTVVNQRVGFGKYAQGRYAHFRGTNGAASNSFFLNNGGTAPTITSGQASYTINIWDGTATYNFSWNFSGSPSGAVSAICTTPIRGGSGGPGMFYATVWRFPGAPSLDHSIAMLERDTLGDLIQATVYKNDGTPATWQLNEFPSSDGAISGVMTIPL